MNKDDKELYSKIKKSEDKGDSNKIPMKAYKVDLSCVDDDCETDPDQKYVQWTTTDGRAFFPASRSVKALQPGLYEIRNTPNKRLNSSTSSIT